MSKDRRATYLRLTPRSEKALNAEQVTQLREAFLARLPARDGVQAFPYRILEWDWHDRQEPQYRWRFRGRTLAANDPLLETEPRLVGRTFQQPDETGVMVTEAMLRELHGSIDKIADPLQVTLKIRPEMVPCLASLLNPFLAAWTLSLPKRARMNSCVAIPTRRRPRS